MSHCAYLSYSSHGIIGLRRWDYTSTCVIKSTNEEEEQILPLLLWSDKLLLLLKPPVMESQSSVQMDLTKFNDKLQ